MNLHTKPKSPQRPHTDDDEDAELLLLLKESTPLSQKRLTSQSPDSPNREPKKPRKKAKSTDVEYTKSDRTAFDNPFGPVNEGDE